MIKLENHEVVGWEHAIRGMRNPMNSWEKGDSEWCNHINACHCCPYCSPEDDNCSCGHPYYSIGPNDHTLMMKLANGGPVHAKYRRMIVVYVDITAPLYWWKEFDTYKVGTVANSCSTMHKIHSKEFTLDDFSHEHLGIGHAPEVYGDWNFEYFLLETIRGLNAAREVYLKTNDKRYWWQMIQLLPSSYNQKRTVMLNYEVLHGIYISRKDHKLDEWREFCEWIKTLPYSEIITGGSDDGSR